MQSPVLLLFFVSAGARFHPKGPPRRETGQHLLDLARHSISDHQHLTGFLEVLTALNERIASLDDARHGLGGWLKSRMAWRRARLLMHGTADLSGAWKLEERHGLEQFLGRLGFNALQRAAVIRAGQVQVIARRGDELHIVTKDIRGSSELVLPLGGEAVLGEGDSRRPVRRAVFTEGRGDITITEMAADDGGAIVGEPLSICRRSLQADGRMCVDVRKRTPEGDMVSMRVIFTPIREGEQSHGAPLRVEECRQQRAPPE